MGSVPIRPSASWASAHPLLSLLCALVVAVTLVATLSRSTYDTVGSSVVKDVQVFDFASNTQRPPHLTPIDPNTQLKPIGFTTLDAAHRQGKIHTGSWIYILDDENKLLMLRRGMQLVTCPGGWSMVGEHAYRDEGAEMTLQRGIKEELGEEFWKYIDSSGSTVRKMTDLPLFYYREYGPEREGRIDAQPTYLWLVELDVDGYHAKLSVDDEVSEYRWMPIDKVEAMVRKDMDGRDEKTGKLENFCHETIGELMLVGIGRIRQMVAKA